MTYVGMLYNLLDSLSEDVRPADLSLFIQDLEAEIASEAATEARRELLAKVSEYHSFRGTLRGIAFDDTVTTLANARLVARTAVERSDARLIEESQP